MFKNTEYTWDRASFNKLNEVFDAIIERFESVEKKIESIKSILDKNTERLNTLEKEPKIINNYYTQQTPNHYTPTYPQPWTSSDTTGS